jgi:hypothetical protein
LLRSRDYGRRQVGTVTIAERSAAQAAQRIADSLEAGGVPYAIGGALALAVAGVPRGTADVDVHVFVDVDRMDTMLDALNGLGIEIDRPAARKRAREEGMFIGRWDGMRIDVFLPSIPFSNEAARTRVRLTDAEGWSGWFLSAEALAVFKLLFFRGKDLVDLERLVAVNSHLDHAYVRRWTVDMMGEDDDRVRRWDTIVQRFSAH